LSVRPRWKLSGEFSSFSSPLERLEPLTTMNTRASHPAPLHGQHGLIETGSICTGAAHPQAVCYSRSVAGVVLSCLCMTAWLLGIDGKITYNRGFLDDAGLHWRCMHLQGPIIGYPDGFLLPLALQHSKTPQTSGPLT
jgi:hypothetical protein